MVRPKKMRCVDFKPEITFFKPRGVPLSSIETVDLLPGEIEAIRLSDVEGYSQVKGAESMGVHQSTFNRILLSARKKIATALINGYAIELMVCDECEVFDDEN